MSPTRRRLLRALPAAGVALAGCTVGSRQEPTATDGPLRTESEPAFVTVRNPTGGAALRSTARTPRVGDGRDDWVPTHWLVATERDRKGLRFAADTVRVDEARALLDDTAFDEASVFVRQTSVPECLTVVAEELRWREEADDTDHLELVYETRERDADCEVDAPVDAEATLVRVPAPLTELGSVSMSNS